MSKKTVIWISIAGTTLGLLLSPSNLYKYCFQGGNCLWLWDVVEIANPFLFLFPGLLIFSFITYFLREEVFRSWLHFVYVWIPLSLVIIYLSAGWTGGGFGIPNVFDQEFVSIIFASLFALISLLLIIWKSIAARQASPTRV